MHPLHKELLDLIKQNAVGGTKHLLTDSYLGTTRPRYPITAPVMRMIANQWMKENKGLSQKQFATLITSLVKGESSTEKVFAGMLLDKATYEQGNFDPDIFDEWLNHLEGWAEIDSLCTGTYTIKQVVANWTKWKPVIIQLSKDPQITKRRASLALLCSPLSHSDDQNVARTALANINRLKSEKEILITKAISWLLRSMVKHHSSAISKFIDEQKDTLPKIAVRETLVKLDTGKKTK